MKKTVYLYLLNTMADWEVGHITSAIQTAKNSDYQLKTVAITKEPIQTMGGLTVIPDCTLNEIDTSDMGAILLPGADTWDEPEHAVILDNLSTYLSENILVAGICGSTLALAKLGLLNDSAHTSNSVEYLTFFAEKYSGQSLYQNELAVTDGHLITANSAGGLLWAKQILAFLEIMPTDYLEAWYQYYATGEPSYYMEMLNLAK